MTATRVADELIVVTQQNWLADDLVAAASRFGIPSRSSLGLDIPAIPVGGRPTWWVAQEHAARLMAQGIPFPMLVPGPHWLSDVPKAFSKRTVVTSRLGDYLDGNEAKDRQMVFAKLAEAKHDKVPAEIYYWLSNFILDARINGADMNSWIQVCDHRLDIAWEARVVIINHRAQGASVYSIRDSGLEPLYANEHPDADVWRKGAMHFATQAARAMKDTSPRAYVMDVGMVTAPFESIGMAVIEANNVWSATPYEIDIDVYVEALYLAADYDNEHPEMHFQPDTFILNQIKDKVGLPFRGVLTA